MEATMSTWMIRLAVVYFVVGIALGLQMAASNDFTLAPVHAHLNLLGWVSLAIFAGVYRIWPATERSRLARLHGWLYNIGLPFMMLGLGMLLRQAPNAAVFLGGGGALVILGILCFVANVWMNTGGEARQSGGAVQSGAAAS
jgi:cbb3-type cytochrome oxidase subunit 1